MSQIRINTGVGLRAYITDVVNEGIKSALAQRALTEKEKQSAMSPQRDASDDLFGSDDSADDQSKSSKTMDDESEKLKQGDIKSKDIVEKLNSIRSGRSFKDSAVSSSMEEYIDSLSKAERVALMAFLKGIAQIVTGEIPAKNASEPSDEPADVQMDRTNAKSVVHKKPNVIKGSPAGQERNKKPSSEDTTSPAPIVPKKR